MKTENWVRLAAVSVTAAAVGGAVYLTLRYCTGILLPFLAAAWIASALRRTAQRLSRRTGLSPRLCGGVLLLSSTVLLGCGALLLGRQLLGGAQAQLTLWVRSLRTGDGLLGDLSELMQQHPAEADKLLSLSGMAERFLTGASAALSETLTGAAADLLSRLPRVLLSVAVGTVTLFYLFFDGDRIAAQLSSLLGERTFGFFTGILSRLRTAASRSLRAYMTLAALTAGELLVGFLLLGVEHPVAAAALIALLDLLPVIGVGTVLLPWSLLALLQGESVRGIGLLVLFAVLYAVRQYAEPHLIGAEIGLHPWLSLLAVFAGYRLGGVLGMLVSPLLLSVARAWLLPEMEKETGDRENRK